MVSRFPDKHPLNLGNDPARSLVQAIEGHLSPKDYREWFSETPCHFTPPDRFSFTLESPFRRSWAERKFHEAVRDCARGLFELEVKIDFECPGETGSTRQQEPGELAANPRVQIRPLPPDQRRPSSPVARLDLHQDHVFDQFLEGSSNCVALSAAKAVCKEPGRLHNPLFLYGPPGVGKTHLLHAMCHALLEVGEATVTLLSADEFLSRFIESIAAADRRPFRRTSFSTDVVIIDNVQLFAERDRGQEELFHLFNELIEEGRQLVLASNLAPRSLSGFHARLTSRFQSGLVLPIEPPGLDLEIAILVRKARLRQVELPVSVAEYVARQPHAGLHELEGLLNRVLHAAIQRGVAADVALAQWVLHGDSSDGSSRPGAVTVPLILRTVQEFYTLPIKDLLSRSKARSLTLPRQLGMFLARELTQLSLAEIGAHFGGRDHTTVLYSMSRVHELIESSPRVRTDLVLLRERIRQSLGQ